MVRGAGLAHGIHLSRNFSVLLLKRSSRRFHSLYPQILLSNCAHHGTLRSMFTVLMDSYSKGVLNIVDIALSLGARLIEYSCINAYNSLLVSIYTMHMLFYPRRTPFSTFLIPMQCLNFVFVGICEGIRVRECDGGTAWNGVKTGDCPLTPSTQDIQVSWILGQYYRHCSSIHIQ